jgi:adenine-specific DNA-methyltransferase
MSEIVFKGKEYVYNHHLSVPYRPLQADAAKSIGPVGKLGSPVAMMTIASRAKQQRLSKQ